MIYVIATVELMEGKRDLYMEEFNKIIPMVRAEKGCLEYGPTVDVAAGIPVQEPISESAITIIERWADVDALKVHLTAPHMKTYQKAVKDYVKLVRIRVLSPL